MILAYETILLYNTIQGKGGGPRAKISTAAHPNQKREKKRAGKNSFPPNPLPFCPREQHEGRYLTKGIFLKKSSNFVR